MATSRTGTAKWKRLRERKLAEAERSQPLCPYCGTRIDYSSSGRPNSPELDHIIPWSKGGQDTDEGTLIVCSRCNRSKGAGKTGKAAQTRIRASNAQVSAVRPRTSREW